MSAAAGHLEVPDVDVVADACSHQLGEAAAIIAGYVGELREFGRLSSTALAAIDGAIDRIDRVVDDLLVVTRVAGRYGGHERFALTAALSAAVRRIDATSAPLELHVEPLPHVLADRAQVESALHQIVRAAAAARGPDQRCVRVSVSAVAAPPGRVRVVVEDDASGTAGPLTGPQRGHGPLVGAGAMHLIVTRVSQAHGGSGCDTTRGGSRVSFDLPAAR